MPFGWIRDLDRPDEAVPCPMHEEPLHLVPERLRPIVAERLNGHPDEIGFHAVESPHYVTDIHATLMQQLGLDASRLDVPGQQRLEIDYGHPINEIIA